jgi:hypothetical protein
MRWEGYVARMGLMRYAYKILVRKLEEKRRCRRSKSRWEDNIKMDLREIV